MLTASLQLRVLGISSFIDQIGHPAVHLRVGDLVICLADGLEDLVRHGAMVDTANQRIIRILFVGAST
jgi:hypothetical protein